MTTDSAVLTRIQMHTSGEHAGCWEWTGRLDRDGYGKFGHDGIAHRKVYEIYVGDIDGELDHLCRWTTCVRPDHLEDVSHRENLMRGTSPSALKAQQTTCIYGHDLVQRGRQRVCLECQARRTREYRARKKP